MSAAPKKVLPIPAPLQATLQEADRALQEGDLLGAKRLYQSLIDQPIFTPLCLSRLATIAARQGQLARAERLLQAALRLAPQDWGMYASLDALFAHQGKDRLAFWVAWGLALHQVGDYSAAAERFRAVLQQEPRHYAAWHNLAQTRIKEEQQEAQEHLAEIDHCFWQSVRLAARSVPEIRRLLSEIQALAPNTLEELPPGPPVGLEQPDKALTSLGYALSRKGHTREATRCHELALELQPGLAVAHWNLSLCLLLDAQQWERGWKEYEWRWHWPECPEPKRRLPVPVWRGEPLAGKTLLVWTEQGYGDTLQFVPLLQRLSAEKILLQTTVPLQRLLAQSYPEVTIVGRPDHPDLLGTDLPVDYAIPLLSLAERLQLRVEQLPLATQYLRAAPEDQERWAQELSTPEQNQPRVALIWAGRSHNLGFENAQQLFAIPGISWYSLQLGPEQEKLAAAQLEVRDLSAQLNDFAQTAAIFTQMDLIISIDSATAHLAGGMGRPVWTILHPKPNFRWFEEGESSPWYPSMRLFRRPIDSDWSAVFPELLSAMEEWREGWRGRGKSLKSAKKSPRTSRKA